MKGQVLLVSNEVGLGVVPMGELTRRFVDEAGRLTNRLPHSASAWCLLQPVYPCPSKEILHEP
jgi:adenosylcobinamide kinase/adenosylcobinamide-phosphate guanylyltransferase